MKHSAYEVAKKVFYEHYEKKSNTLGNRGRVENLFDSGIMYNAKTGHNLDYRPSIDLMFLATLDNEARKAGDTVLANKVQGIVEWAIERIYFKVIGGDPTGKVVGDLAEKTTWGNALVLFYLIKATSFIKFFMNGSKRGTPMMKRVDEIRMKSIRRSMELYETTVWKAQQQDTIKNIVRAQKKFVPTSGSGDVQAATVLNVLSVLASGLAMNSYFVGKHLEGYTAPTDYKYRQDISDIGNYLMQMCFGNSTRQQCNYGGSGEANRSEYVISGYSSWIAGNLALIGYGTVYPDNFWERPASAFLPHVPKMYKAFQDAFNYHGYLPDTTKEFGQNSFTYKQDARYPNDTSAYLYTLAYYGDQGMIDWIESKIKANANVAGREWATNDVDIKAGDTVIEAVIRRDLTKTAYQKTGQAYTTRGVESLAAAMFKRLSFND